jgi:hypothetical protein
MIFFVVIFDFYPGIKLPVQRYEKGNQRSAFCYECAESSMLTADTHLLVHEIPEDANLKKQTLVRIQRRRQIVVGE